MHNLHMSKITFMYIFLITGLILILHSFLSNWNTLNTQIEGIMFNILVGFIPLW